MTSLLEGVQSAFKQELSNAITEFRSDLTALGNRTDALESKTDDLYLSQHRLDAELTRLHKAMEVLKDHQEDEENRSRRNNLRIHNISESVFGSALSSFLKDLFQEIIPNLTDGNCLCDRAHRALRAKPSLAQPPRDVIVRLHYFRSKDRILSATRDIPTISFAICQLKFSKT